MQKQNKTKQDLKGKTALSIGMIQTDGLNLKKKKA